MAQGLGERGLTTRPSGPPTGKPLAAAVRVIVAGQSAQARFAAFRKVWGQRPNPPVITGVSVAALAHPDFLVEIDAVAVIPMD